MFEQLRVQQYRCFTDLTLDLRAPGPPGSGWTILVGENGTGKTSLLQAVVLGLLDPRPIASLLPDAWTLCRQNLPADTVTKITLTAGTDRRAVKSIHNRRGEYVAGTPLPQAPLTLAFSARRRIARPGELPASENLEVERVRGLFDTDHALLMNDAFAGLGSDRERREFARTFRDVVVHETSSGGGRLFPLVDIELRGREGITTSQQLLGKRRFVLRYGEEYRARVAVQELSDGYQAMLSIVLEILVQASLASSTVPVPAELQAVILIDELEAHLHPRWQRTVIPLLREIFPRCQFIVTTHSPLVVAGAEPGEVRVLEVRPVGDVVVDVLEQRLSAVGAEGIFESVFGVPHSAAPMFVEQERRYVESLADARHTPDPELRELIEQAWADARTLDPRHDPS